MPEEVHRLRDIMVEEVSLVDRAANKRRFLLVKREGGEMNELRSDGHGGFTRVRKGDDEETEKAKKKPAFEGAAKPFGAKPTDDDDDDEEKSKKAAKKPPPDDDDDKDEDEEKRAAAKAASDVASKLGEIADDLQSVAQKMDAESEPNDAQMKKVLAAHRKLGGMAEAYMQATAKKSIEVAKVGAKMSSARLSMYKEALATLQSLLSELLETPKKEKEHEADAGDPQLAAPGWQPSNPSGAPTNATGAAAMKQIEKAFTTLVDLAKVQAAKIARLEKGVTPSNALAVDSVRKNRGDEVVWPVDVNARPRDKSVSFLDD